MAEALVEAGGKFNLPFISSRLSSLLTCLRFLYLNVTCQLTESF